MISGSAKVSQGKGSSIREPGIEVNRGEPVPTSGSLAKLGRENRCPDLFHSFRLIDSGKSNHEEAKDFVRNIDQV